MEINYLAWKKQKIQSLKIYWEQTLLSVPVAGFEPSILNLQVECYTTLLLEHKRSGMSNLSWLVPV
jgi:hypothetical protein